MAQADSRDHFRLLKLHFFTLAERFQSSGINVQTESKGVGWIENAKDLHENV